MIQAWRDFILLWITRLVWLELMAVLGLACAVVCLLFARKWRQIEFARRVELEGEAIVAELLALLEGQKEKLLHRFPAWRWLRNQALREALLSHAGSVSGGEREYLIARYLELGFAAEDLAGTQSSFWSRRLAALVRLSQLSHPDFAPVFDRLQWDPNRLVGATACVALSGLRHDLNHPEPVRLLPLLEDGRLSLFRASFSNWCALFGFDPVFRNVVALPDGELRDRSLSALLGAKTMESGPALLALLEEKDRLSDELIGEILSTLREIAEPAAMNAARELFDHDSEMVKQRAAEVILEIGAGGHRRDLKRIKGERSAAVRRVFRDWRQKRRA